MNLVYISPHYPTYYGLFVERLAARQVKVFGISDRPDEGLAPSLRQALSGHYRVDRLDDTGQVLRACRFFQNRWGPIDRVESHLEPWIQLEALIRENFNVPGPKPSDLRFIKEKSQMKQVFQKAGVQTAKGMIVQDYNASLAFINGRYPVFIKPDIGVGAADTFTIKSKDDLNRFYTVKNDHSYFMEEFLSGRIESFDGLTDQEGNILFYTSHIFSNDIHKIVVNNENLSYYSVRRLPPDLEDQGKRVVNAAGIREKFFHIEFFRLPDGTLRALEINMRPPGGLTAHMFNFACDIDVYDWWAKMMTGMPAKDSYERKYHCAFIARKFDRPYAFTHEEILSKLGDKFVHYQEMNPIEFAVMGNVGYLVRSPDENEIHSAVRVITQELVP